ncbi:MAG: hypothetical protein IJS54_05335 [Desulfovibrio sp.]|nr:hypothetical protein [Desulfovibrio sp.]
MKRPVFFCCALILCLALGAGFGCSSRVKSKSVRGQEYVNAVELKLKFRELADQMLTTMPNALLEGFIGMPTSFVDQNNTSRSSQLGRLIAESMFYEFNQRGFPTREYRLTGNITVTGAKDDLVLIPNASIRANQKWASLVLGTYLVDEDVTFINARLVRASDGVVQRTAQLVLLNTPLIERLAQSDSWVSGPYGQPTKGNVIPIIQQR